jgi:hypothetical protein
LGDDNAESVDAATIAVKNKRIVEWSFLLQFGTLVWDTGPDSTVINKKPTDESVG